MKDRAQALWVQWRIRLRDCDSSKSVKGVEWTSLHRSLQRISPQPLDSIAILDSLYFPACASPIHLRQLVSYEPMIAMCGNVQGVRS